MQYDVPRAGGADSTYMDLWKPGPVTIVWSSMPSVAP
jgi:hypothetical protein